jgi:hypothetical protein
MGAVALWIGLGLLALAWWQAHRLGRLMAGSAPVRSRAWGPVRHELRRRTSALGHADRRGRLALAQAFEQRIRVLRVAGLPVWGRSHQIELPASLATMLPSLTARDFDADFPPGFREARFVEPRDVRVSLWRMSGHSH